MEHDRWARRQEKRARRDAERRGLDAEAGQEPLDQNNLNNQSNDSVEAQIRKRVEGRLKEREAFMRHLVSYVAVNTMLWAIWAFTSRGFPWPMLVTLAWGIGLASNAIQVYQNSVSVAERREATIEREMELERRRLGLSEYDEKPKRDRAVSLSDDGELVPLEDDDQNGLVNKAKRG